MIAGLVGDFAQTLVSDSFTECFKSPKRISYNYTVFLYIFYVIGVIIRWCILLPLRMIWFMGSIIIFSALIMSVQLLCPIDCQARKRVLLVLFKAVAKSLMFSFGTIIRVHGKPLPHKTGQIYVCNHTSTFDFGVLSSIAPCSTIGQRRTGL